MRGGRVFDGRSRSDIARIFGMHRHLLTCNPYHRPHPVFHFLLDDVVIPFPDIRKSITRCHPPTPPPPPPPPPVSSISSQLRPTLYFLCRLGFTTPHQAITCQTTLLVSSIESTLIPITCSRWGFPIERL
ncbi:hypothetical protein AAC387_Pa11g0587 [Persea americana]